MSRLKRHSVLGLRWLHCGWRQFRRNPWLLGGMGLTCSAVISMVTLIPLVGRPVVALLAPIFLASAFVAVEATARQKVSLPAALRLAAFKRSPRALLGVFQDEERAVPLLLLSLYSVTAVLLIDVVALVITGNAWVTPWTGLDAVSRIAVAATAVLVFAAYLLLAASLIYTLPLAFLQGEALVPALTRSIKASLHYRFALSIMAALLLAPSVLATVIAPVALWGGYLAQFVLNAFLLPLVAASLYCSYRSVFPPPAPMHVDTRKRLLT